MGSRLDRVTDWTGLATRARFNAKNLAAQCDVSLRQLERYCKGVFNKSPEAWLNEMRLGEAETLLRRGLPVKEISYMLGFKQVSHFCREFKRHKGRRPNESPLDSSATSKNNRPANSREKHTASSDHHS